MVALFGAVGVTLVGFGGSEVLFGPGAESVGIEATLLPSIAAGLGAFIYLLVDQGHASEATTVDDQPLAPVRHLIRADAHPGAERRDEAA